MNLVNMPITADKAKLDHEVTFHLIYHINRLIFVRMFVVSIIDG